VAADAARPGGIAPIEVMDVRLSIPCYTRNRLPAVYAALR
jgi:hypothetical protein